MPNKWKHTLDISAVFHDEDLTLKLKSTLITDSIKSKSWYAEANYNGELEMLIEELVDASEEEDKDHWDFVWNCMYDIFDAENVWVKTL